MVERSSRINRIREAILIARQPAGLIKKGEFSKRNAREVALDYAKALNTLCAATEGISEELLRLNGNIAGIFRDPEYVFIKQNEHTLKKALTEMEEGRTHYLQELIHNRAIAEHMTRMNEEGYDLQKSNNFLKLANIL